MTITPDFPLIPDTDGIRLSARDAKAILAVQHDKVHTFVASFGWMGADVALDKLHAAIDQHGAHISDMAAHLGHRISVMLDGRLTYLETDENLFMALLAGLDLLPQRT